MADKMVVLKVVTTQYVKLPLSIALFIGSKIEETQNAFGDAVGLEDLGKVEELITTEVISDGK